MEFLPGGIQLDIAPGCFPLTTDSMALAYFSNITSAKSVLDLGAGCGTLGLLLCSGSAEPLLQRGTGSESMKQTMPAFLPDRLEAGTHNMPGIAGLLEGLRFVRETGIDHIAAHERQLAMYAAELLAGIDGVELFCDRDFAHETGVLSFRVRDRDCEEMGECLAAQGAAVRAGLHCAPLAHRTAGTLETGTIRLSTSVFNTPREVEAFAAIVRTAVR